MRSLILGPEETDYSFLELCGSQINDNKVCLDKSENFTRRFESPQISVIGTPEIILTVGHLYGNY